MTGLMIKDWLLLKRQGRYFVIVVVFACIISFSGSESFSSFVTSYLTFMITMFSFSSFSYDEVDNGMAYLMALPSGRRDYVKAKYLFSILLIAGGWFAGCLMRMILFLIRFSVADYLEILPSEPIYLLFCLVYISGGFPVILKYGAEKGRNIVFMTLALFAAGVFMIVKFRLTVPVLTSAALKMIQWSETWPMMVLILQLAACILILWISYLSAVQIMEKKEF